MSKFLAVLFIVMLTVALSAITMIYGWGVHPKSWAVIIGVGVFANTFLHTIWKVVEKETK